MLLSRKKDANIYQSERKGFFFVNKPCFVPDFPHVISAYITKPFEFKFFFKMAGKAHVLTRDCPLVNATGFSK